MSDPTLAEYRDNLRTRRLSAATIRVRTTVAREILDGYGSQISVEDLILIERRRWSRLSVQTHCSYVQHARDLFAWLQRSGLRADNPAAGLTQPRVPKRLPNPMPEDDLSMALACAPQPLRAWIALGGWAGLRVSEMAGLDRADVREAGPNAQLRIRGKGDKERIVDIGPLLVRELARYRLPRSGRVFVHDDGRPYTANRVSQMINLYLHGLGIPLTAHKLRHRYATSLLHLCGDISVVGAMLGHESVATTMVYAQWNHAAGRRAALELDGSLERPSEISHIVA